MKHKVEHLHLTRAQVEKALGKVGPLQSDRLEWALRFCQEDISPLGRDEREDLRFQVAIFAGVARLPDHGGGKGKTLIERFALASESSYWPVPSWKTVVGARAAGRNLLSDIAAKGRAEIGPFKLWVELFHPPVRAIWKKRDRDFFDSRDEIEKFYCREHVHGYDELRPNYLVMFPYQLAQLIGRFAVNVGQCADEKCRRWFVGLRVTRKFCSDRCKSRAAVRAMRARQEAKRRRARNPRGSGQRRESKTL